MGRRKARKNHLAPLLLLESPSSNIDKKIPVEDSINCSELTLATPEYINPGLKEIWVSPQFSTCGKMKKSSKRVKNQENQFINIELKNSKLKDFPFKYNDKSQQRRRKKAHEEFSKSSDSSHCSEELIDSQTNKLEDIGLKSEHNHTNYTSNVFSEEHIFQLRKNKLILNNESLNEKMPNCLNVIARPLDFINGRVKIPQNTIVLVPTTPVHECGLTVREKQLRHLY